MLQKFQISHDELIGKVFEEFEKVSKSQYTSLFLSSLSGNKLSYRAGLPVLAIMQSFSKHSFEKREDATQNQDLFDKMSQDDKEFVMRITPCKHCASFNIIDLDFEFFVNNLLTAGGLISPTLKNYYYCLSETNKFEEVKPKEEDFSIFSKIIEILSEAEDKETIRDISSKIRKIRGFKSNSEQRKFLLETLGYCSILETNTHKGLLNQYTNLAVAPGKTHSSNWNYPVDFWTGKDGINKKALEYWFGEYKELDLKF